VKVNLSNKGGTSRWVAHYRCETDTRQKRTAKTIINENLPFDTNDAPVYYIRLCQKTAGQESSASLEGPISGDVSCCTAPADDPFLPSTYLCFVN